MEQHPGKFRLADAAGQVLAEGPCTVAPGPDHLAITGDDGAARTIYYSDIDRISDRGHEAELLCADTTCVTLWYLGAWYGQFLRELRDRRSAQLIRNLLMLDTGFAKEFQGACALQTPGASQSDPNCRIGLYRSSLVVQPEVADAFNVAYADIIQIRFDPDQYALILSLDGGGTLTFRMLGTRFGELEQEIRRLTDAMYQRTADLLRAHLPDTIREVTLHRLARVLRQGRAVPRDAIAAIEPGLWPAFQTLMFAAEEEDEEAVALRRSSFAHLERLAAEPGHIHVGLRESFTEGDEPGRPICWFLIAYPDRNRIATEVTNQTGNATYIYRMDEPVDEAVRTVSRAMTALNFRRDVISAAEQELADERMARYRVALRKLPYLRDLRARYAGKAAHTSDAAWRRKVESLLG